jgi:hypothetical protein
MSHHHHYGNNFTRVVNSDVQTSAIIDGVSTALLNINSSPGFTGFSPIVVTSADIILSANTINSIAETKTMLISAPTIGADRKLVIGEDTKLNAQNLIKAFGLDKDANPKLIRTEVVGGANAAFKLTFGTTGGSATFVSVKAAGASAADVQDLSVNSATKGGFLSVALGSTADTVVFDVVVKQTA